MAQNDEKKKKNWDSEDVIEKQEELKDNVRSGVRGGALSSASFVWALFLDDEAWWRLDLMCGVTEHTSKTFPPIEPLQQLSALGKIRFFTVLVLFSLTAQDLDKQ